MLTLADDHARKPRLGQGYSGHAAVSRPTSRGRGGLRSADPWLAPLIDPRFPSTEHDIR